MTEVWPPPADESSKWQEFTPRGATEAVKARRVELWGRSVWVADFDGVPRVWCPDCSEFLGLDVLGKPFNGHAVGIKVPEGSIVTAAPGDDGPGPVYRPRWRNLLREPW